MKSVLYPVRGPAAFQAILDRAAEALPLVPAVRARFAAGERVEVRFRIDDALSLTAQGIVVDRDGELRVKLADADVARLRALQHAESTIDENVPEESVGAPTEIMDRAAHAVGDFLAPSREAPRSDAVPTPLRASRGPAPRRFETDATVLAVSPPSSARKPVAPPSAPPATAPSPPAAAPPTGFTSGKRAVSAEDGARPSGAMAAALVGRTLGGKYVIERLIGNGAMGAVLRGQQLPLGKPVAIKVMHAELAADPSFGARFFREAKMASLFDHPNAVRVLDFGEEPDGLAYLVMELVEGRDLSTVLHQDWPLPPERVVGIAMQVLGVLARAHDEGIVHRDLKPDNILLVRQVNDDGEPAEHVKVCDFGIAKLRGQPGLQGPADKSLTAQGFIVGTPEYMSPEQAQGEAVDARSDVYSVGVLLYHMATGELPFQGETAVKVMVGHITRAPEAPSKRNADADPRFDAICLKALAKDPKDRYTTAREMRRAIADVFLRAEVAKPRRPGSLGLAALAVATPGLSIRPETTAKVRRPAPAPRSVPPVVALVVTFLIVFALSALAFTMRR